MKNLEFVKRDERIANEINLVQLNAKLSDSLANLIREKTRCPKDRLEDNYLSKDNIFSYEMEIGPNIDQIENTIESIANSMDEETFVNHILKNDGSAPMPADMHELMKDEFNLEDDIEWYTSLFFVNLGWLLSSPEFCFRSIEEDMEAGDCVVLAFNCEKENV